MDRTIYREIKGTQGAWTLAIILAALIGIAGLSVLYVEHNGHAVTGMNNQIVWGLPHVFAIFLIVAASGALNVASMASVFNNKAYKPCRVFPACWQSHCLSADCWCWFSTLVALTVFWSR